MLRRKRNMRLSMKPLMNRNNSENLNLNDTRLKKGDEGEEVENLQKKLTYLTYFYPSIPSVKIDGFYGDNTQKAVKRFQELMGIYDTGNLDKITLNKLELTYNKMSKVRENLKVKDKKYDTEFSEILKQGSRGKKVIELQEYLNKVSNVYQSIPKLDIDGLFGAKTKEAVLTFQRVFKLKTDGIVGKITWDALYNVSLGKGV